MMRQKRIKNLHDDFIALALLQRVFCYGLGYLRDAQSRGAIVEILEFWLFRHESLPGSSTNASVV
jgi:hypothetical protein